MYDVALFLHICGVVLLVGAVTTTMLATLRAQKAETVGELRSLTAVTKTIDRVIGPAMLLILAPGLYMVSRHGDDGSIRWSSGWVDVAIAVFLLMAVLGPAVETRHAKRLLLAAQDLPDGPVPPDVDELRRTPSATYVTMFGAGQIVAFLYLMTNKPALPGAVATCVIAAVVSLVVGFLRLRSLGPAASEPAAGRRAVSSDATGTR